jgi:membrane protease YdiL (CAAX protease family)
MVWAAAAGTGTGILVAWLFGGYDKSASPMFTDVWMAITLGPLAEELIFRGYLFWAIGSLLARLKVHSGAAIAVIVAVLFALAHASKSEITGPQLLAIFGTGTLYGWLRLNSGSTVSPVIAHILFNAVIYLAAVFV